MRRTLLVTALLGTLVTTLDCSADRAAPVDAPDDAAAPAADAEAPPDTDASAKPAEPGSLAGLCKATYGTIHDSYDACCTATDRASLRYQIVFGQLAVIKESCTPQLEASAAAGRIALDDAALQSCTNAFATFFAGGACGKDLSPVLDVNAVPGCNAAVAGKQALGKPCLRDYECENGLTCVGFAGPSDGVCTKSPPIGDACGAGKADGGGAGADAVVDFAFGEHPKCAMGATCNRSTRRCVASLEANEPCSDSEQCKSGLACLLGSCSAGTPAAAGGACRSNKDCNGTALFCELAAAGTTGKCASRKPAGAPCTAAGALGGSSCSGQCVAPDGGAAAQCVSFCGSG